MPENWVDIAVLLVVAWNVADGVRRGLISALVDFVGFLLSIVIAITFYVQVGEWASAEWNVPALFARPAAFGVLWLGTSVVIGLLGTVIGAPFAALLKGSSADLVLSIIPSALKGVAVSAFTITVILAVPPLPPGTPGELGFAMARESIQDSRIAGVLVERTAAFDRFVRDVLAEPLSQTLTTLTVPPEGERVTLNFRVESPGIDPAAEERILVLLNEERVKAGLRPVVRDATIDQVARAHSIDMLRRSYFGHETPEGSTPFDRMRVGGVRFSVAGENLALAPTATLAHQGLMASPG
ncbi:MAG: colicin production protein, partial [Chloroflexi bacterium]|nr:colicin production protein [Chloroflexota bacterium]